MQKYLMLVAILLNFPISAQGHENHSAPTAALETTITGVAQVIQIDFSHRKSEREYFIIDSATGTRYQVHFDKKAPLHFKSGNTLTISGRLEGETDLYLDTEATELAAAGGSGGSGSGSVVSGATGNRNLLVLSLSFGSGPACDNGLLEDHAFAAYPNPSVSSSFYENSFGKLTISGNVAGPVTILSSGTCDYYNIANQADSAAQAAGYNLSQYTNKVYMLPPGSGCEWYGLGEVGGGRTWIEARGCSYGYLTAHELGHNLGMGHASTYGDEYGDPTDFMGRSWGFTHVNGPHKIQMGWTPLAQVATVNQPGRYNVEMLEVPAVSIQTLKIPITSSEAYYVSYRRGVGLDGPYLAYDYWDRASIIKWSGYGNTYFMGTIGDGETFSDSGANIYITQNGHNDLASDISVNILSDVTAPTAASNLVAQLKSTTKGKGRKVSTTYSVQVSWLPSSDGKGVAGYDVYRNGVRVGGTTANSYFVDNGTVAGGGTYEYYVIAFDQAGNRSEPSNIASITR
jgi:hypothetical protein